MRTTLRKIYGRLPVIHELKQILAILQNLRALETLRVFDLSLVNDPRYSNSKRLLKYQFRVNSQNGEDGIINEIMKRIGVNDKVFVEIGVGEGTENNTAFLLSQGWSGYWIDSVNFLKTLQKNRITKDTLKGMVTFVNQENIVDIFSKLAVPKEFDILSLDIDQNTYYIWEVLEDYKPRVIVVEYNSFLPPDINWKVNYDPNRVWDGSHNFGASLKAYELLGNKLGYSLVGCDYCGANAFFVRNDLLGDLFEAPFTAENHYEPYRWSLIFNVSYHSSILDRKIE
jgi:hypothetical protein